METGKMKLVLSAGALALSMALAGCGGGSSSGGPAAAEESPDGDGAKPPVTCSPGAPPDENNVCTPPSPRPRAGQDTAKALHGAINQANGRPGDDDIDPTKFIGATASNARVTLKEDKSFSGVLSGWKGAHYKGDQGTSGKLSAESRIYSNKEAPTKTAFPAVSRQDDALASVVDGVYTLDATADNRIKSDQFPTGTASKTYDDDGSSRSFAGTYEGAQGTYTCTGVTCQATAGANGIVLADTGTWKFTPARGDAGKADKEDDSYARFGWWVYKNDGKPTHAVAFADTGSSSDATPLTGTALDRLDGKSATYKGSAAGKFAIYQAIPGNNESGHFTADAELKATFKTNSHTMSGTIDNFILNDGDENPVWSIALMTSTAVTTGGDTAEFTHPHDSNAEVTNPGTVWSIDEKAVEGSNGTWGAKLFHDDDTGNPTTVPPDTAFGTFSSEIGSTHKLTGAFGATHQPSQ